MASIDETEMTELPLNENQNQNENENHETTNSNINEPSAPKEPSGDLSNPTPTSNDGVFSNTIPVHNDAPPKYEDERLPV